MSGPEQVRRRGGPRRWAGSTGLQGVVVAVLIASLPFWFIRTAFMLSVATLALLLMTASLGWNVISGFGGQISFGHSIFFGLGAYTTVMLQLDAGVNAYLALLVGVVVAVVVALLLGALTLRLRGIYFSLATFALTLVFAILFGHYENLTGGEVGLTLPLLGDAPGSFSFADKLTFFYVGLLLAAAAFTGTVLVRRSRLGLQLRAVAADQEAARACGVRAFRVKLTALALSAVPCALAGGAYVQFVGFIDPDSAFGATIATQIAVIVFVGGAGRVWGPVLGAALLVPLQQLLNSQLSAYPAGFNLVVYAVVVLVILWIEPRGILSMRLPRRRPGARPRPPGPAPAARPDPAPAVGNG